MDFKKVVAFIRRHLVSALCVGGVLAVLVLGVGIYQNVYRDAVHLSFVYPNIEDGQYPDGERFLMYDFLDNDVVGEALSQMQQKGWYTDITLAQLQQNLSVSVYLSNPVQEKVESSIASGKDFSYYSNEYIISFSQPNPVHLRDWSDFFGLFRKDRSEEFLDELVRAYIKKFTEEHADSGQAFYNLTASISDEDYDFTDITDYYKLKVNASLDYLQEKDAEGKAYVAKSTGLSFKDLIASYQALLDVDIQNLESYVKSSRLTKNLEQFTNRNHVLIESDTLSMLKQQDEAALARTAMEEYDHTFTENIIIVSENEENGLYQARPKTGYDTVTQRTLTASTNAVTLEEDINELSLRVNQYTEAAAADPAEYARMCSVANQMVADFDEKYEELFEKANATINEYLQYVNGNYIETSARHASLWSTGMIVKALLFFVAGFAFALLFAFAGKVAKTHGWPGSSKTAKTRLED